MSDFSTIGIVILAAGASTRLGTPKQLLQYRGRSLLRHTAEIALASGCQPIVVVLGAQSEQLEAEVQQLPVTTIRNSRWAEGMSSSIQTGLKTLRSIEPTIEAVIILLCDQPFVSVSLVHQLIEAYDRTGTLIVASEYADTLGVPALFSHALFPVLMTLQADRGARFVIQNHVQAVARILFPLGTVDIDTSSDYEQLLHTIAEQH
ncbi:nucleotidyltransferase family protein [Leptolyngbya sp. NIES-2104]|uniref:nucleotidyltransferase family protein n=1 Tax=Leptolyngbya sp. NIES-2104 TaxID=1552121 RepID=UPI0006ECC9B8|nr:nucleotidyltransferase family protein [Leptolyngbya sp. NIES-2104]GAP96864.1 CTP:molybdopterin cytidylyltransferase [Leptolyngbya sp. NIES-2104]